MKESINRYTRYEIGSPESLHEMDLIIECLERLGVLLDYMGNKLP